jgi:hypothetical protein
MWQSNDYNNFIRICEVTREEIIERWTELHSEELHNLISLENITGEIKSRMRQLDGAKWLKR